MVSENATIRNYFHVSYEPINILYIGEIIKQLNKG